MRRLLAAWLLLMLAAVALPLHGADAATVAERAQVVDLVNQERARSGLAPLWQNDALTRAAEGYAAEMADQNFFSHTGPDGSTIVSRSEAAGYRDWTWLGENIAAGQTTPEQVFQAWMNSPGHRANILSPRAREIGIGRAFGASARYRHYWTMSLGDRAGAAPPAAAPTATPTVVPTPPPRPVGPAGAYRLRIPVAPRTFAGSL